MDKTPTPVDPNIDPEIPATNQSIQLPTAPLPDEAYLEEQTAQENRWVQAAATNPEGVQRDGSIKTVNDAGVATTVNRDGSYVVQDASGTTYYDPAGQQTAYTTPTVDGLSVTTTTDGVQYTNYTQGPLTTSTITNNGEPISTTVSYDAGYAQITSTQTGDQVVNTIAVPQGEGIVENYVVDTEGQIIGQSTTDLAALREQGRAAYAADQAASEALVSDALAAKQAAGSFQALDAQQAQQLQQAAAEAEQAAADLAQAEENLADADPLYVSPEVDPQVSSTPTDDVALFDIEVAPPDGVSPYGEEDAPIELVDNSNPDVANSPYDTQEFTETLADLVAEADDASVEDPIVLAAAEQETVTDVPVNDLAVADDTITDFTFEDNASLGYSEPFNVEEPVPADQILSNAEDIGTSPYTAGTEDFIPVDEIQAEPDTGFSPYGEADEQFDPNFVSQPDPALFTDEYVQEQDNPFDGIDYDTDGGISPYGEDNEFADPVPVIDPFEVDGDPGYGSAETEFEADNPNLVTLEAPDPYEIDGAGIGLTEEEIQQQDTGDYYAAQQQNILDQARAQAARQAQLKQSNDGDWRVKLRLGPAADYLYRSSNPGILQPLAVTDGVVFPYTPEITTAYRATYNNYDLTHSNYRGYFYQGSHVDEIVINAMFTAQDTSEANYLLAVITFFKSVTKMFYGQDAQRGAPPPLVFLQGLGEFQFNLHPCVVSSFNYNLPADVDYIRARSVNTSGTNLLQRRDRQTVATNVFSSALDRLSNAGLKKGGLNSPPASPTLGTRSPTYVPTKMNVSIALLPMQSRKQVSQQFSLRDFANGNLIKGGFW